MRQRWLFAAGLVLAIATSGCDSSTQSGDGDEGGALGHADDAGTPRIDGSAGAGGTRPDPDDGGSASGDGAPGDAGFADDAGSASDSGPAIDGSADDGGGNDGGSASEGGPGEDSCESGEEQHWFVDSVRGDDAQDGRCHLTPFATLARLKQGPLEPGAIIHLARGSFWREELADLPPNVEVHAYGVGPRPILDGSDIAANTSFRKVAGRANVYEISWRHDFTPEGGNTAHRAWENGVMLRRAVDLAACDATPGSFYADNPTSGGPDLIYVHASDGSAVTTNGRTYELARRAWAIQLRLHRDHAKVYSMHTRRNAHAAGSLVVDGFASNCLAEDGRIHNVFIRGTVEDTVAWKIEPPSVYGGATMFISYENVIDLPHVTYRRCSALADPDALGPTGGTNRDLTVGFYGHTNGPTKFGTALYEECHASNVTLAFAFDQLDHAVYYKCSFDGGQLAISPRPYQSLAILGGTYRSQTENSSVLRLNDGIPFPQSIIIRGIRVISNAGNTYPIWIDRPGGTIEISRSTFVQIGGGIFWFSKGAFDVRNNVFYGRDFVVRLGSSGVEYESDRNLYFETSARPAAFQIDATTNVSGLPEWRAMTRQDLNSIDADPLFVTSQQMDPFGIGPNSPAWILPAGAHPEGEEADEVLQEYRRSLTAGLAP